MGFGVEMSRISEEWPSFTGSMLVMVRWLRPGASLSFFREGMSYLQRFNDLNEGQMSLFSQSGSSKAPGTPLSQYILNLPAFLPENTDELLDFRRQ